MKHLILVWLLFYSSICIAGYTEQDQDQLCTEVIELAQRTCTEALCSEAWLQGEKCIHDGYFLESFQSCTQTKIKAYIDLYQQEHSVNPLQCSVI